MTLSSKKKKYLCKAVNIYYTKINIITSQLLMPVGSLYLYVMTASAINGTHPKRSSATAVTTLTMMAVGSVSMVTAMK